MIKIQRVVKKRKNVDKDSGIHMYKYSAKHPETDELMVWSEIACDWTYAKMTCNDNALAAFTAKLPDRKFEIDNTIQAIKAIRKDQLDERIWIHYYSILATGTISKAVHYTGSSDVKENLNDVEKIMDIWAKEHFGKTFLFAKFVIVKK